jgi:hypothetical protein
MQRFLLQLPPIGTHVPQLLLQQVSVLPSHEFLPHLIMLGGLAQSIIGHSRILLSNLTQRPHDLDPQHFSPYRLLQTLAPHFSKICGLRHFPFIQIGEGGHGARIHRIEGQSAVVLQGVVTLRMF